MQRVFATLAEYRAAIDEHGLRAPTSRCSPRRCATQPMAPSSPQRVREDYRLDAHVLQRRGRGAADVPRRDGRPRERRGAHGRDRHRRRVNRVRRRPRAHGRLSRLAAGRRRAHERAPHPLRPARAAELQALAHDVNADPPRRPARARSARRSSAASRWRAPPPPRRPSTRSSTPTTPRACTATRCCSRTIELLLARLADMTEPAAPTGRRPEARPRPHDRRRDDPAGEALRAFELEQVEVSEHDILYGGALRLAGLG